MAQTYQIELDGNKIRFTPEGKVAVLDAIRALTDRHHPEAIWRDLRRDNPGIDTLCENYRFSNTASSAVVDGEGWAIIEDLLMVYIIE
jgi:hypothetical protein